MDQVVTKGEGEYLLAEENEDELTIPTDDGFMKAKTRQHTNNHKCKPDNINQNTYNNNNSNNDNDNSNNDNDNDNDDNNDNTNVLYIYIYKETYRKHIPLNKRR